MGGLGWLGVGVGLGVFVCCLFCGGLCGLGFGWWIEVAFRHQAACSGAVVRGDGCGAGFGSPPRFTGCPVGGRDQVVLADTRIS